MHIETGDEVAHAQNRRFWTHGILWRRDFRRRLGRIDAQQIELAWQRRALHRAETRHGGEQGARVGVVRRGKNRLRRPAFDTFAAIHDLHAVGNLGDHAHVVRDEDDAHLHFVLQGVDERQDLRLDGHVERRRRLVGDEQ